MSESTDRIVVVTGGSRGIGRTICTTLSAPGTTIYFNYNSNAEAAQSTVAGIEAAGGKAHLVRADASKSGAIAAAVEETAAAFGRLDGLINNAGGMVARLPYAEMTDDHYDAVMDLNGRSVLAATRAALPHMKTAGGGFVINTTSIAARNGASGGAGLYGSSKAFIANVTRGMAKEFIPFGIRVNAVAPGVIETPFHERYSTEAQLKAQLATVPQGRLGVAEDCVGAYLFLACASLSGYIIGQTIEVNGGMLMP